MSLPTVDWHSIAANGFPEWAVAIGTVILAGATFVVARESVTARTAATRERRASAFRAALVELLSDCQWWSHDPTRSLAAADRLRGLPLSFVAVDELLAEVDMRGDVLARLVWLETAVRERQSRLLAGLDRIAVPDQDRVQTDWHVAVDYLQTMLCLVQCEARCQGFAEIVLAFEGHAWLAPSAYLRRIEGDQIVSGPYFGAPPQPTGAEYVTCDPAERDRVAQEIAARDRAASDARADVARGAAALAMGPGSAPEP